MNKIIFGFILVMVIAGIAGTYFLLRPDTAPSSATQITEADSANTAADDTSANSTSGGYINPDAIPQ